jgi:hypothetical protein
VAENADVPRRIVLSVDEEALRQAIVNVVRSPRIELNTRSPRSSIGGAMNDYFLSLIRTGVPAGIGAIVSYLAVKYGIVVPEGLSTEATIWLTGGVITAYYALVRALEKRWPKFGVLLGAARKPLYAPPR